VRIANYLSSAGSPPNEGHVGHKFAELAFTPSVREVQEALGSRANYAAMEQGADYNHVFTHREAAFVHARDSFYMASVSETGWPYVQHRGGPAGFVRVLDERTLGFADFRGNRQYVSVGNVRRDDRVALFFMDYPNRVRLKVLGHARLLDLDSEQLAQLQVPGYRARVERGFIVRVEAFDWNCPQHITPRYTESEIQQLIAPLIEENRALKSARGAARMTQDHPQGKPMSEERPPLPPFTLESAIRKVRLAEDAWNSRDPARVALAYTADSQWRNRAEFPAGRDQIVEFLTRKWRRELDYRLIKELWTFADNRIAVRFAYEWRDDAGHWYRSYGNENWEFDPLGLMQRRYASINDLPIAHSERKFHWPQGRRPDDHPGLSELGL
jgi:nuclear transport factor 2 (NTF2) superfamily protein/predicted pyridoxine 5'-phosphate oxidase superfamily flavin-nucleotide-binding protein